MYANSTPVASSQSGLHPRLDDVVRRHLTHDYRRPVSARGLAIFESLRPWLERQHGRPLILDSGCGTGASTRALALNFPEAAVLGADRSIERLSRGGLPNAADVMLDDGLALVRINLEDLWPLLLAAGVRLHQHCIWYPNPSPKPEHLKRRWHAHPLFPCLLALGGALEVRSNWKLYIDEFAQALTVAGRRGVIEAIESTELPVTPFERKYRDSGQALWRLRSELRTQPDQEPPQLPKATLTACR